MRRNASRQSPTDPDGRARAATRRARGRSRGRARASASTGASVDSKPSTSSARRPRRSNRASSRVDQPAVARVQPGLRQRAHRLGALDERAERDAARSAEPRPRLHPHPRLGDHAEDPLGAQQHPVRRRPRPAARQPPRLPQARRRDRAHGLDEVVDVRQPRREVPARARGDPAAQRRQLERLREEAHRHPVLAELLLEPRPVGARPGCARRARRRRPPAPRSSAPRSRHTAGPSTRASTPPTTLVPPP